MIRITFVWLMGAVTLFCLTGCASHDLKEARRVYFEGNAPGAAERLESCDTMERRNRLLCYLERGLILHDMEEYGPSTQTLLKAVELMDDLDQISISGQTSAILASDRTMAYQGEYSEKLWVHTYLMMNFLLQHKMEGALVEARQALEVFTAHSSPLKQAQFTRALAGLCFENMGLYDDARIEYDHLSTKPGESTAPIGIPSGAGELILFVSQGRIPVKEAKEIVLPPSVRISIPHYVGGQAGSTVNITENGKKLNVWTAGTDMGLLARHSLEERSKALITRQVLRAGAKEGISRAAGRESETGEILARIILLMIEGADTRSWELLPGSLTLMRIPLPPGHHDLRVEQTGFPGMKKELKGITLGVGERIFRAIRF